MFRIPHRVATTNGRVLSKILNECEDVPILMRFIRILFTIFDTRSGAHDVQKGHDGKRNKMMCMQYNWLRFVVDFGYGSALFDRRRLEV
jgi:hypothetical protein